MWREFRIHEGLDIRRAECVGVPTVETRLGIAIRSSVCCRDRGPAVGRCVASDVAGLPEPQTSGGQRSSQRSRSRWPIVQVCEKRQFLTGIKL